MKKKLLNLKPKKKSHFAPGFRIFTLKNFFIGRWEDLTDVLEDWRPNDKLKEYNPGTIGYTITVDQHIVIKKMRYICLFVFHQNTVCTLQVFFDFLFDFQFKNCDLISISQIQYETKLEGIRVQHSHFYQFALLDFFSEGQWKYLEYFFINLHKCYAIKTPMTFPVFHFCDQVQTRLQISGINVLVVVLNSWG